jgi:hypothetical protein
MLANPDALEYMYDAWLMDKTKTVYGNIQIYKAAQGGFERSKTHQLAHYSFEGSMNLQFGIMPVSTMHSKEAHYAAGGWKAILAHGREDLEYWIACGKAGFCGLKINHTTLLYRKHEQSRDYKLKFELKELNTMQHMIKEMHSDVYRGEFPMACCGKSTSTPSLDPVIASGQSQAIRHITTLEGYDEKDLEWVAYRGPKRGSAGRILVRGPATLPSEYPILGNGHVFQIHKQHKKMFSDRQKLGFEINQPDPREQEQEPVQIPAPRVQPQVVEVPKPELATLVRLDGVGGQTREANIVSPTITINENDPRVIERDFAGEAIVEPNPPESYSDTIVAQMPTDYFKKNVQAGLHISSLRLSDKLTETLVNAGYTVEKLAGAEIETLTKLPGIGDKRGEILIQKAQEAQELIQQE